MKHLFVAISSALFALATTSCDLFEAHPYDTNVSGDKHLTATNIALIETQMEGRTEMRFAMISDTQRWYDETQDVVDVINERGDIDFVVHGGDQSDFGLTDEFTMQRDILQKLDMPFIVALGNHDCLGTGLVTYNTVYGDENFAFTAGNVRFIVLNTNGLDLDFPDDVPDFDFIANELDNLPANIDKTIFLMHAKPYSDQFPDRCEEFEQWVNAFPNTQFCIYGHNHDLTVDDLFDDGVIYYQCPNIAKRYYLVFTIYDDGYDYEAETF